MPVAKHLVHRGLGQAALQHRVRAGMAERDPARRIMRLARALYTRALDALDPPTQGRERAYACARHAPLLKRFGPLPVRQENQKLAHLFMICSNIKLTGPRESIELALEGIHEQNQLDSRMDVASS